MKKITLAFGLALTILLSGCQLSGLLSRYGIFDVIDAETATMNGVINKQTERHFANLMANYPQMKTLILEDCPGSSNDEVNLRVALEIHRRGINTELRSDSEIASGAVDLFLAGKKRTIPAGAKVGVHSWGGSGENGDELPQDHPNHKLYIDYYVAVGMSLEQAQSFYFFTLQAAPANDIHWMTEAEIQRYGLEKSE